MARGKFFESEDVKLAGKSLKAIQGSRDAKARVIAMFGGRENLPTSVMRAERINLDPEHDAVAFSRSYDKTSRLGKMGIESDRKNSLKTALSISGRGTKAGALSAFPQNVGRSVVLLYTEPGDVVFDPFAGHNSRMELCVRLGRHYVGCDLSEKFMARNRERAKFLRSEFPSVKIKLNHCDSRKPPVPDASADFTLTSPPYYDIEEYGDEPEQLGKAPTYQGFMDGMTTVLRENFRILKPGAFCVYFINDFRRKGRLHFYHIDLLNAGLAAGFSPWDIMVVDLGRTIRECFVNQTLSSKILPKRHEYGVVFRKET